MNDGSQTVTIGKTTAVENICCNFSVWLSKNITCEVYFSGLGQNVIWVGGRVWLKAADCKSVL